MVWPGRGAGLTIDGPSPAEPLLGREQPKDCGSSAKARMHVRVREARNSCTVGGRGEGSGAVRRVVQREEWCSENVFAAPQALTGT